MVSENTLEDFFKAAGVEVTGPALVSLNFLLKELFCWSSAINLTAIKTPKEVIEKHIIDSLTIIPYINQGDRLLDAGSGAGFPGLPLKICCPSLTVFSVEASRKKVYFQRKIVRSLKIQNFFPLPFRLENLHHADLKLPPMDVVVSRALGSIVGVMRLTRGFLADQGRLILMKSVEAEQEMAVLNEFEEEFEDLFLSELHDLKLPLSGATRKIFIFRKK